MNIDERTEDEVADHVRLIVAGMTGWLHKDNETIYQVLSELAETPGGLVSLLEMCYVANARLAEWSGRTEENYFQRLGIASYLAAGND